MKNEFPGNVIKELFGIQSDTLNSFGLNPRYDESTGGYYYQHKQVLHAWHKYKQKRGGSVRSNDGMEMNHDTAKTLLTIEQLKKLRLENELTLGIQAPIAYLKNVLSQSCSSQKSILESIPLTIKRRHPEVSPELLRTIEAEITKARNAAASLDHIDWERAKDE